MSVLRVAMPLLCFPVLSIATICDAGYEDKLNSGTCEVCEAGTFKASRGDERGA